MAGGMMSQQENYDRAVAVFGEEFCHDVQLLIADRMDMIQSSHEEMVEAVTVLKAFLDDQSKGWIE